MSRESELRPMDAEQLREQAHRMVDFIADSYKTIENLPVLGQFEPGYLGKLLPDSAPNHPEPLQDILSGEISIHESVYVCEIFYSNNAYHNETWQHATLYLTNNMISPLKMAKICHVLDVQEKILPGVTHWQSPNYFAYFPSNSSIAGFLGEMLSAGLNVLGFSWITSPAATELEIIVPDWVAKAFQLPDHLYSIGNSLNCCICLT